ncbi:MAG TPA: protease modulator HflC [Candidatus Nanoarchaeia archaeon]|nr:protease modulator HflC [Candidatus Nanoarchaeia archaeon]
MTLKRTLIKAGIAVGAFITVLNSVFVVDQTEQAVITKMGNPKRVIINPIIKNKELSDRLRVVYKNRDVYLSEYPGPFYGLYFKIPFVESVNKSDRRIQSWDGTPEQITTSDKRYIWVDAAARWIIEDPLKYGESVKNFTGAQAKLDDVLDSDTKTNISKHPLIESVRNSNKTLLVEEAELRESIPADTVLVGREGIENNITTSASLSCKEYGIGVLNVIIKRINYVESVKISIEDRMISERKRISDRYMSEGRGERDKIDGDRIQEQQKILSEAYRKAERIRGLADGIAARVYAEAYSKDPKFYQFYKTLNLYRTMGDSTRKEVDLVIGTDNDFFKYLKEIDPKK